MASREVMEVVARDTVAVLHGLGVDHRMWALQLETLQGLGGVWAPDLPGFGGTPSLERGRRTAEGVADWVADGLRRLGRGPAHVLGYSMGGTVGLLLALRHPHLVSTLAVCCSSACWGAGWRKPTAQACVRLTGRLWAEVVQWSILRAFSRNSKGGQYRPQLEDMVAKAHRPTIRDLYLSLSALDLRGVLPEIRVPTLVVAGSRDWLAPAWHAQLMARRLPAAELCVVRGADHVLCLSHALRFSAILAEFLSRHVRA